VAIVGLVVGDILEQAQKYRTDYIILGSMLTFRRVTSLTEMSSPEF